MPDITIRAENSDAFHADDDFTVAEVGILLAVLDVGSTGGPEEAVRVVERLEAVLRETLNSIEPPVDVVGNVVFDDTPGDAETAIAQALADAKGGVERDGMTWFDDPYLRLDDPDDPDDEGPLFLMYGTAEGGTVFAPACGDANELERRLIRAFGPDGWTLDDHGEAVAPGGCTGYRDEDGFLRHDGDTCPAHEGGPAARLRRYIDYDRLRVLVLTENMPEETRREYLSVHDEALAAVAALEEAAR